jgi:hypothetical protein
VTDDKAVGMVISVLSDRGNTSGRNKQEVRPKQASPSFSLVALFRHTQHGCLLAGMFDDMSSSLCAWFDLPRSDMIAVQARERRQYLCWRTGELGIVALSTAREPSFLSLLAIHKHFAFCPHCSNLETMPSGSLSSGVCQCRAQTPLLHLPLPCLHASDSPSG